MKLSILFSAFICLLSANSWALETKENLQLEDRVEIHRKNEIIKFFSCHLNVCSAIGKKAGYSEKELRKLAAVYTVKQDMGAQLIWNGIEAKSFVIASALLKPIVYEGKEYSYLRCSDNKGISDFLKKVSKSNSSADYVYPMQDHRAEICAVQTHSVAEVVKQLKAHLETAI